ncbi:cytochrome P450 [Natronoglycomyces albus]|uniref:Cytochrome P450 n=1 Tax=Natronoglycomyces albus TaxID=2811108 RepID=A0A895XMJ1_9ACTN|nr:cytochrome P450 [Natronoglycomyces albus]QSB06881.1 cytochrome P450 [Natronoglycomyces albus]
MLDAVTAVGAADPYPYYASLTSERPLSYDPQLNLWVAASADVVAAILNANAMRVRPVGVPVPPELEDSVAAEIFADLVRMRDDAGQPDTKDAIIAALSTVKPGQAHQLARSHARDQLADGIDYERLQFNVPVAVIASLCGLKPIEASDLGRVVGHFVKCISGTTSHEDHLAAKAAAVYLHQVAHTAEKEQSGLVSTIVAAAAASSVPRREIVANTVGLLSQTYDASAGLVGNTLLASRSFPTLEPTPSVVEEVSRWDPPIHNTRRFAAAEFSFDGHTMQTGQAVLLVLAAANRDPAVNRQPHIFDQTRSGPTNFTFSQGKHRCPGRTISIAIALGVWEELLHQGWKPTDLPEAHTYRPSRNARIPNFANGGPS